MLYSLFLYLYYSAIKISVLWNPKARLWLVGRKETKSIIKDSNLKGCIWFHVSSLGEFEQISFLIEKLKTAYPNTKILLSFFSPSGYELKKNFQYADLIIYLPFDFQKDMIDFINIIEPKLVFWVRYEFWVNTLRILKNKNIPTYLINGVFYPNINVFYKSILINALSCFQKIFVINEKSNQNLKKLGFDSEILADSRYDRMNQVVQIPFQDNIIQDFVKSGKIVVCGSTWASDDEILKETIKERNDIHWILVPHEVDKNRIKKLSETFPNAQTYSKYQESIPTNILIIDTIGLLSKLYRYADIVYVGGGFEKVVHSLIEPLSYTKPIIIGKNIEKSEEAKEFIHRKYAMQIFDSKGFNSLINQYFTKNIQANQEEKIAFLSSKMGSVDKILAIVKKNIDL